MNIQLDPGELITITTPQGFIAINADLDTEATLVSVAYREGHKLTPKMSRSSETGEPLAQVWIEPAGGL